ncbi:MAG: hypothetical protein ACLFV7_07645 [Phycisphaerae bacterium]
MSTSSPLPERLVWDTPGWPAVAELAEGKPWDVRRSVDGRQVARRITVLRVRHQYQPDEWIEDNDQRRTIASAAVDLDVSGTPATLLARPYEMPAVVNGLRIYAELTDHWAHTGRTDIQQQMEGAVRLSVAAVGEPWGPATLRFPIGQYRWHSSSYRNTWNALVPFNNHYYHRGDDFGAIPDILEVLSPCGGVVTASPLPFGDDRSNAVGIRHHGHAEWRLAHMNVESIDPHLTPNTPVTPGQAIARTGCTWAGRKSQIHDPHLHVGLRLNDIPVSTYPYLVEAYLRDYDDSALAVAGGWHFALPGKPVRLDASRCVPRAGRNIDRVEWHLSDGRTTGRSVVNVSYDKPGLYAEELRVQTSDGREYRDFAHVRVWNLKRGRHCGWGWVYHTPVRGVTPKVKVTFRSKLVNLQRGKGKIDFGDRSRPVTIEEEVSHVYDKPGTYSVRVTGKGPGGEPVCAAMPVIVESADSQM